MIGFILAAGFGTRLKPITDTIPKALVPINGEPLLSYNLRKLRDTKIFSAIGVNSHYLHGLMVEYQKRSSIPFELFYESGKIRGTGGALDFARDFLKRDDSFMVANVDILHKFNLSEMSIEFRDSGRICSLVSIPDSSNGTILYDSCNDDYLGIVADRGIINNNNIKDADFTGITFYRREFLDFVTADDFSVIPIWKRVMESGGRPGVIFPGKASSWWMDIGTREALDKIESDVKSGEITL